MTSDAATWLSAFAELVGRDVPNDEERGAILSLAGMAAHASERTAAPIGCWLAASAGLSATEAIELARGIELPAVESGE